LAVKSYDGFTSVKEKYTSKNIAVTKQQLAKWHDIANAVFRIVQNHGE